MKYIVKCIRQSIEPYFDGWTKTDRGYEKVCSSGAQYSNVNEAFISRQSFEKYNPDLKYIVEEVP